MSIVDWIYPKTCFGCGREGMYICDSCCRTFVAPSAVCPVCMKPAFDGWVHARCRTPYGVDRLIVGLPYKGAVQKALKKVKYASAWDIVQRLFECWTKNLASKFKIQGDTIVTSVPMYAHKQRERGFNQADILGQMVARHFGIPYLITLDRTRETPPMYGLSKKERTENVKGAFQAIPTYDQHLKTGAKLIILVDDVWTTGATIKECIKILKRRGINEVWALTLAR